MIKLKKLLNEITWVANKERNLDKVKLIDVDKLKTNPNEKWSKTYEDGFGKTYTDKIAQYVNYQLTKD